MPFCLFFDVVLRCRYLYITNFAIGRFRGRIAAERAVWLKLQLFFCHFNKMSYFSVVFNKPERSK
nr:MAG TPA: hypothetical protein [Microviridae sp.]